MTLEDIIETHLKERGMIGALGIEVCVVEGRPVCRMTVDDRNIGAPDVAHGGSLMALLDTALGAEAMAHSLARGCGTSTVELKVNFLRPARRGVQLLTESRIDHAGRSLLVVSGTARDAQSGEAVALALGTFNVFSLGRSLGEAGPAGSGARE